MPKIPLEWLAEFVSLPEGAITSAEGASQVAADLARVGLEEEALEGGQVTGPLVVGKVLDVTPEPQKNGKTINWCHVDVGAFNPVGEPGRGIVCGAHNFQAGDLVVVCLPGAVLPGPFEISARKTYGHISDGMICSERELGLGEDHDGIIVLTRKGLAGNPGDDAIALLGLNQYTLDINVTPDRGYCFSVRGVAREYSHATGAPFTDPAGLATPAATAGGFAIELADDAPIRGRAGCDRFAARVVRGIDPAAPSPAWMKRRLADAGMRPLSLAVDVTNYVMLELGQPMHAYDLDQLNGPITVRRARAGEKLTTLDDVERALDPEDLLITDAASGPARRIIGIAGVMGGAETEVSESTTAVLLEAAHFDQVTIARSARRHKLPSEASRRFERGVDPALPPAAIQRAVDLLVEFGGGTADEEFTDVDEVAPMPPIAFDPALPARLIGVDYTDGQVNQALSAIGCVIENGETWSVQPPSWRPDLQLPVDLVEEVARVNGYDQIGLELPVAPAGAGLTSSQRARRLVAAALAELGLVEVASQPWISPTLFDALGMADDDERRRAVLLTNPLSEKEPALRTALLASLPDVLRRNIARGMSDVGLFELGVVALPAAGAIATVGGTEQAGAVAGTGELVGRGGEPMQAAASGTHGDAASAGVASGAPVPALGELPSDSELAQMAAAIPAQPRHAAGLLCGNVRLAGPLGDRPRAADWADAIDCVRLIADRVGAPIAIASGQSAPFHPGRCAEIRLAPAAGQDLGAVIGHAGELHPAVCERMELPARTVGFEIDLDALIAAARPLPPDPGLSTLPLAKEDLALVVADSVSAADLLAAVERGAGDLLEEARIFDCYTGDQIEAAHRSLAISLRLRGEATLTSEQIAAARSGAIAEAERACGAVLRT